MRLFVSFSGRDQELVRRLLLDMTRHGIEIWDYSRDDAQIPAAVPVREGLTEQLRRGDTVIVLVSAASAAPDSKYTQYEVQQALALGLRIVPVHLVESPPAVLSPPFVELERRELRYVSLGSSGGDYERGISDILSALGVRYRPRVIAHQRLPLVDRFEAELLLAALKVSNSAFTDMGILAQAFGERYAVSDWRGALKLVSRFCDRLVDKWPAVDFYYPYVAKGVCELHLEEFREAERTFSGLLDHPLCDENAYAGRGHAYFGQRQYRRALNDYVSAATIARRGGRSDAEIEINRVTTLIELGEDVPDTILNPCLNAVLEADLPKVRLLRGIAFSKLERWDDAQTELAQVARQSPELREIAVSHLADVLAHIGRTEAAARAISDCLRSTDHASPLWLPLHHRLAALYTEAGLFERALPIYRNVLCVDGSWTRQYMTECARLLRVLGDSAGAAAACRMVIATSPFGIPATPHDHYYFGLALYMIGRHDAAEVSFGLSGRTYPEYSQL